MQKLFSFNKFFLFFCAVFVIEWLALQIVGYMRLTGMAKVDCERILGWDWPDKNLKSFIEIYDTKILKRNANDAIVKVLAKQSIQSIDYLTKEKKGENSEQLKNAQLVANKDMIKVKQASESDSQSAVVLTYYRTNSQWFLGKVECQ